MLSAPAQVMDGVWKITLPLPFELNHVNVYLIALRDGWMLVDCGLGTDASLNELREQLESIGLSWNAITTIFLTHTHPDHVGQAKRLLALTGAKLLMHADELDQLQRVANSGEKPLWLDSILHQAGVPAPLVEKIEGSFDRIRENFHGLTPDVILQGGEELEAHMGPLRLILTPGHSPGHLCLYSDQHRVLFAGDHVLETITPNIGWLPERDALGEFYSSLDLVHPLEVEKVLPGHGRIFQDHKGYVVATKQHHDERCEEIIGVLSGGRRTAHQLVSGIWTRPLAPFHHRFAVFEVLAHLEYLERRGRVRSEVSEGLQVWMV